MKLFNASSALIIALTFNTLSHAQISGGHSYMKGNFVELGINGNGAFEGAPWSTGSPPFTGYHPRSGGASLFGFVANPQMDGWVNYDGDFFTPGTPENGWGFTLQDGAVNFSKGNNCASPNEIPCSVQSYSNDPVTGCIETQTAGNYTGSGYNIDFQIDYLLKTNNTYYTTTVTIQNNSGQVIDNFYYYRTLDPDNNEPISWDFSTQNTIVAQPTPTCGKAHVSATSNTPWPSYIGLAGIGQEFRVSHGGFTNRDGAAIWNALPGLTPSFSTITSSGTYFGDNAISLAYRIQNFAPGQVVQFKFVVILDASSATAALGELFFFEYTGSLGGPPPSCSIHMDSVVSCTGNPVELTIQGPVLSDFNWTWSPAIGLSSSTGTSVSANPPSATTYTVTGTPATACYTTSITQSVFVDITQGPEINLTDPGPQCISFNLNNLIHEDVNAVPGAHFGFYTIVPSVIEDTLLNVYPGNIITPGDSVNLVYWDPVGGCMDYTPVHIAWGSLGANLSVVNPDCGLNNGEITVNITSSTPSTYTYTLNGGAPVSSGVFTGLPIGSYTIIVSDTLGCSAPLDTTLIYVNLPSITSVTPTNTLCTYTCDGTVTVNGTGGTTPYTYSINGGTPQTANVFNTLCPAIYNVTLIDAAGCTADATATVAAPVPFTITPSSTQTICVGQTATISATTSGGAAPISIIWHSPLTGTGSSMIVDPDGTTTYNVHAEDNNGCVTNTANITVIENPPLGVIVTPNQAICPGDTASFTATGSGGNGGPYTYVWTPGFLLGPTHTVQPSATTTYSVTVTDGCTTLPATGSTTVTLHPLPAISFTADVLEGCNPVVVNFTNTTPTLSSGTCNWVFSDGGVASGCNVTHVFNQDGTWDVTLHDVTVNGCEIDTTIFNMITVHPIPIPDFTWTPFTPDVFNPGVTFANLTIGGMDYQWDIAGLHNTNVINPSFEFPNDSAGVYQVCLNTVSVNGCEADVCHEVVVNGQFLIYVPNAFTPDGNGLNDIFLPRLFGEDPDTYEFFIFNRWGQVIFKTTNTDEGWDGTHNGIKAKEDVYVWKIKVKDAENSKKYEYHGSFTLLR